MDDNNVEEINELFIHEKLAFLNNSWKGKVCIFGAGQYGRTWGSDILLCAGLTIDFYCDNRIKPGTIINKQFQVISPDELYSYKDNVYVFIAATGYEEVITKQLKDNGIIHIAIFDIDFIQNFIEGIEQTGDRQLMEQYYPVVDDGEFLKRQFLYHLGYPLNLEHPRTFNEKLQWLKLYNRKPEYVNLVDKYTVKKYIANLLGNECIIPTLGVWDTFDEIALDQLPKQFVLKCTHDSGGLVICKDKSQFDKITAKKKLELSLKRNYYYRNREWQYKDVKPRIIAEKYMEDANKELRDYKFFCFDGVAKAMFIATERGSSGETKFDFYDMDFKHLDIINGHPNSSKELRKPENFQKMIDMAESVSKDIPQVRVDFYEVDGLVYFGELTFAHWGGLVPFQPETWDEKFGSWISLPAK